MQIEDYSQLSNFISEETDKILESSGGTVSKKLIKFQEKQLLKYSKLYSQPLFLSEKRKLALQKAIETMPHGLLWKIFNKKLWNQIKELEAEKKLSNLKDKLELDISKNNQEEAVQTLYPAVVREYDDNILEIVNDENED